MAEQLLIPLRPSPRTRIYCRRNTTSNAILYLFTGFTFSCLPGETVHMLLFCSPNPKVCRRNLVLSPLLQVSQAFMQVLFKTLTNQVLHWLVLPINIAILLRQKSLCDNIKQGFAIFIFTCSSISLSSGGSMETSMSSSSHLLLAVVPGNVQPQPKQETKQVFYFEVAFYFPLALYTEFWPG